MDKDKCGHANILIIDTLNRTMEYFEPHGGDDTDPLYNKTFINQLKNILKEFIIPDKVLGRKYKFFDAKDYLPLAGIQSEWEYDKGLCALFTVYYTILRISNPDIPKLVVSAYLIGGIEKSKNFRGGINNVENIKKFIDEKNPIHNKNYSRLNIKKGDKCTLYHLKTIADKPYAFYSYWADANKKNCYNQYIDFYKENCPNPNLILKLK